MKFIKKELDVSVVFADAAGEVLSLEGPIRHAAGDAILIGIAGERWPIRRQRFEATYEAVPPTVPGQPGTYRKIPVVVDARQLDAPTTVTLHSGAGTLAAARGDWLVTDPSGAQWVVRDDIFLQTYQAVP